MGKLSEGFRGAARSRDGGLTPSRLRTAMIVRHLLSVCGCLLTALGTVTAARGEGLAVGVNVTNPQRLSPADREAVLDQLQAAGVRLIRAPLEPPWGGNDYGPVIDFIRRAYERGIKADLIVGLQFREDAQRRPAVKDLPKMWASFPLSSADPVRFRAVFEPLLEQLERLGITFAALELGNEINWTAFNGEFPIPGEGRVFGLADLTSNPEARQIAEGFRAYLQTLRVLRDIRDHSRLNRGTPILSAGLADPGPPGPRSGAKTDAVAIGATLQYLRANGVDTLVDAYGVHAYPSAKTADRRLNQLGQDTLAECRPPSQGKPCWLTEWGLPASGAACPGYDVPRTALMREMLGDFHHFGQEGRLKGLLYFSWDDRQYGIYRCGAVSDSGRLVLSSRLLD
jgi:hypothetical protein